MRNLHKFSDIWRHILCLQIRTRFGNWKIQQPIITPTPLEQAVQDFHRYTNKGIGEQHLPNGEACRFYGKSLTTDHTNGLLLSKEAKNSLANWMTISDRSPTARFSKHDRHLTTFNYMPQWSKPPWRIRKLSTSDECRKIICSMF